MEEGDSGVRLGGDEWVGSIRLGNLYGPSGQNLWPVFGFGLKIDRTILGIRERIGSGDGVTGVSLH